MVGSTPLAPTAVTLLAAAGKGSSASVLSRHDELVVVLPEAVSTIESDELSGRLPSHRVVLHFRNRARRVTLRPMPIRASAETRGVVRWMMGLM